MVEARRPGHGVRICSRQEQPEPPGRVHRVCQATRLPGNILVVWMDVFSQIIVVKIDMSI